MATEAQESRITFTVDGREIQAADELTIRDAFEAEKYLSIDPQTASAVQSVAVLMFAGFRQAMPDVAPEEAAEAILSVKLGSEFAVEGGNGDRPPTRRSAKKSSSGSARSSTRPTTS